MKLAPSTSSAVKLITLSMALLAALAVINIPTAHAAPVTKAAAPAINGVQAVSLQNPNIPFSPRDPLLTRPRASTGDKRENERRWSSMTKRSVPAPSGEDHAVTMRSEDEEALPSWWRWNNKREGEGDGVFKVRVQAKAHSKGKGVSGKEGDEGGAAVVQGKFHKRAVHQGRVDGYSGMGEKWDRLPERHPIPEKRKRELRQGGIKESHGSVEEWSGTPDLKPTKKRAVDATF
jgi:hypothetical protein